MKLIFLSAPSLSMCEKESPNLKLATNGFILSWTEYSKPSGKGETYSHREYLGTQEKVFTLNEKDKAMDAFIALGKECGYKISESKEVEESE